MHCILFIIPQDYSSSLTNTLGLENILMASSISASRVSSSLLLSLTLRVSLCRGRERSSRVRTPRSVGEGEGITEGVRILLSGFSLCETIKSTGCFQQCLNV